MPKRTMSKGKPTMNRKNFKDTFDEAVTNVERVIKGKTSVIQMALTSMIAEGHVLLEDAPGTGKTMLARALARTIDATASRVQCTPDLLPADITGSPVLDRRTGGFTFREGPLFGNIVLADEINRATPKTQSAFLEAMQEKRVTSDGVTYPLPNPFFVIATQNPIELSGTFPLPEAQLDRFMFKLTLGYPDRLAEAEVLVVNAEREAIEDLKPVVDTETFLSMIRWATGVTVTEAIRLYVVDLVAATRGDEALQLGASTRASLALMRSSRVLAAAQGREDVLPDDVRRAVPAVLEHRLILAPDAVLRDESVGQVVERVLARVKVPMGMEDTAS